MFPDKYLYAASHEAVRTSCMYRRVKLLLFMPTNMEDVSNNKSYTAGMYLDENARKEQYKISVEGGYVCLV